MVSLIVLSALVVRPKPNINVADRIRYDGHCLVIDGKDTFIYSGAFHYFRCPKPLWRDRLKKMKEAGLNTVETYVPWNWHERTAPKDVNDYSKVDMADLRDFLKMVHDEFGMYSIIRPGPYICAEWSGGGYPRWLISKRPKGIENGWYRTDDPTYLEWCKHWYNATCPTIAKEQITHKAPGKGGTILFQIENEYDYAGLPYKVMTGQLRALRHDAKVNGIDVPLFTCWTRPVRERVDPELSDVFDGSNLYSRHDIRGAGGAIASLRRSQPNAPVMVPELQGGWFAQIGGILSEDQYGIEDTQIRAITLESILQGGTILSYYMFFGGSHLDDYAARGLTATYDYNAPIREWGGTGDRYQATRGMGEMLREIGSALARSEKIDVKIQPELPGVKVGARRGSDGRNYIFVFNSNEKEARTGDVTVTVPGQSCSIRVNLPPFDYRIAQLPLSGNSETWWPKEPLPVTRPMSEPTPIPIAFAFRRDDPGTANRWIPRSTGQDLLDLGVSEAPFTLWRSKPTLSAKEVKEYTTLDVLMNVDDAVIARVNGTMVVPQRENGRRATLDVKGLLKVGENAITLLYEDKMLPNGGIGMEKTGFVVNGSFGNGVGAGKALDSWKVTEVSSVAAGQSLVGESTDDSNWQTCAPGDDTSKLISNRVASAVYRTTLELTAADIAAKATRIRFERIDDSGIVYINGKESARHNDWSSPLEVNAEKLLHPGKNVIAVIVSNRDGEGGLTMPVQLVEGKSPGDALKWEVSTSIRGVTEAWWTRAKGDVWAKVPLNSTGLPIKGNGAPTGKPSALATWYSMEFELPATKKGEWFPWSAVINGSGNGFVYLNGHPVGRYWQVGPQRQFFLPECFLNFGPGKKNVLSLCLRPTSSGAVLGGVEIKTYPGQGEIR